MQTFPEYVRDVGSIMGEWARRQSAVKKDDSMAEKPTYKNKTGKIADLNKSTITIVDQYNKPHTFALEPGAPIHRMLEGAQVGDTGEWNNNKNGFCVYWKCTEKKAPCPVKSVSTGSMPTEELNQKAKAAGFNISPGVVDVAGDAVAQAQARVDAAKSKEDPVVSQEDRIRAVMLKLNPSDRVGMRISLAGAVNSILDLHKLRGDVVTMDEVKAESVELFLWMDSLTTNNLSGV